MDVRGAARAQGPAAHASVLAAGAIGLLGGLAIAAIRIIRDGEFDSVTLLWIVGAIFWGAAFSATELLANRRLGRAARDAVGAGDLVFLFRVGQITDGSSARSELMGKGWVSISDGEILVWALRGRTVVWRCAGEEFSRTRATQDARAYAVLAIERGQSDRFEAIPVQKGIHNVGVNITSAREITSRIDNWHGSRSGLKPG